jgi:hypothetical protein
VILLIPLDFKLDEFYFVLKVLIDKAIRLLVADWFDYFALGHEVELPGIKPRLQSVQDTCEHISCWSWLLEYRPVLVCCVYCPVCQLLELALLDDCCSGRFYDSLWIVRYDLDWFHFILRQ